MNELSVSLLRLLDRSRWKLSTTLSYGSRCGIKLFVFYKN
ncbi:hypothetical protein LEP1GSC186_4799 [Leptospira noguchii serovar Autumnalis str. ZUN142]|uniref:Uncharacterized protein n=1 Tax=Leptospira noguchii serovar Autumnalis str. ZUN142 TaxID=1085540 RepID=M6U6M7_9LEPT|nr:hypothetical protein LEP1GSC186_4799 [Leptospira noguchii serovar Autumnalis str. ZUN142]